MKSKQEVAKTIAEPELVGAIQEEIPMEPTELEAIAETPEAIPEVVAEAIPEPEPVTEPEQPEQPDTRTKFVSVVPFLFVASPSIQFRHGEYATEDAEEIKILTKLAGVKLVGK